MCAEYNIHSVFSTKSSKPKYKDKFLSKESKHEKVEQDLPEPTCCFLPAVEDIKLNSTVFHWPEHIQTVFELSNSRMATKRENLEEDLRRRVSAFEDRLGEYMKEVESFKKKEVSLHW